MPLAITVTDNELAGFSPQAVTDFEKSLIMYKVDLLKEIGRIEAGANSGSGFPEITSRMIVDAELLFSRGSSYKKKKGYITALKIAGAISLFIAGLMADRESLQNFSFLILFIVVVIIAVALNTVLYLRES
ncbi:hypothetical protein [Sphingomonas melonis]